MTTTKTIRLWSEEELEFLRDTYPAMGANWCAEMLGRPHDSIFHKASRLGLVFIRPDYDSLDSIKWQCHHEDDESGCWLWKGSCNSNGSPILLRKKEKITLRERVWELAHPNIKRRLGSIIRPKCGCKNCLNPEHLVQVTWSVVNRESAKNTNLSLRARKNTLARIRNGTLKLTWEDVDAIRMSDESHKTLAEKYGVRWEHIWHIRRYDAWKRPMDAALSGQFYSL